MWTLKHLNERFHHHQHIHRHIQPYCHRHLSEPSSSHASSLCVYSYYYMYCFFVISDEEHYKKQKHNDDSIELKSTPKIEIKENSEHKLDRSVDSNDMSDHEMNPCLNKSGSEGSGSLRLPLVKSKSPPPMQQPQGPTNTTCTYNSMSNSGLGKNSYVTPCMNGLSGLGNEQTTGYYTHHSPVDRSSSSFLPVTTSPNMLQQQSAGSPSLGLHSLSSMNQMQQCRLPGTSIANTDCAMRQPSHITTTSNYGLRESPTPQHPALSSCTYMQTTQGTGYSPHLAPNVHMMNMNFPGPMA